MNKNAISRFLSGAARTYTGSLQGKLESLADEEEKKRQRNQEYIDFLTNQSRMNYYNRGNQPQQEQPETFKSKDAYLTHLLQTDPEKYYQHLEREEGIKSKYGKSAGGGTKSEKPPENITGAPSYEDIIIGRTKQRDKEITDALGGYNTNLNTMLGTTGIEADPRKLLVPQAEKIQGATGKSIGEILDKMSGQGVNIPDPYHPPTGQDAMALLDSVTAARQNPDILNAFLVPKRATGQETAQNGLLGGNQGAEQETEIAKAQRYVQEGKMTKEEYDEWLSKYLESE